MKSAIARLDPTNYLYCTEAAMLIRVFIYNLFVLFRYEILD